jgi:hypothetical protein
MIFNPAGEFTMGGDYQKDQWAGDNEQPQHTLYLADYFLAKTPVTNSQYRAFVQAKVYTQPSHGEEGRPRRGKWDHSVGYVPWHDALTYYRWLSEIVGKPKVCPAKRKGKRGQVVLMAAPILGAIDGIGAARSTTPAGSYGVPFTSGAARLSVSGASAFGGDAPISILALPLSITIQPSKSVGRFRSTFGLCAYA